MRTRIYADKKACDRAWYLRTRARELATRPPDPILALVETERAYIAGLIDGEGCIRISKVGGRSRYFYPEVGIAMTYRPVIEWMQAKLSSGSVKLNNHTRVREGWKPQVGIKLHGARARLLCEILLPYLQVKRAQAEVVLAFPVEGRSGPGKACPDHVIAARRLAFEQMRILNQRGKADG